MFRRKQAEEEYHLIKNLSQSIANKHKTKRNDTIYEAFGNYVAKALSEVDKVASNLAQNKINNIIFQAQAGLLTQEIQTPTVIQPQPPREIISTQSCLVPHKANNIQFMGKIVCPTERTTTEQDK